MDLRRPPGQSRQRGDRPGRRQFDSCRLVTDNNGSWTLWLAGADQCHWSGGWPAEAVFASASRKLGTIFRGTVRWEPRADAVGRTVYRPLLRPGAEQPRIDQRRP